jgi:hypothetical protein
MRKAYMKFFCIVLVLAGTISAFAIDITGTAPTIKATDPNAPQYVKDAVNNINNNLDTNFNNAINEIKDQVGDIDNKPEKFIQAWGNSSIFASNGATQRAYGGYDVFAVTVGPMIGLQLPSDPFTIIDEFDGLSEKFNKEKDIELGLNIQMFNARVGINASRILMKNLYLGLQFGLVNLDNIIDGLSFNTFTLGVTANYQLIPQLRLARGILVWRGVNVGSGLIYTGTKIKFEMGLDAVDQSFNINESSIGLNSSVTLSIDPTIMFDMNIDTVTIPLEATTAVRLLWFLNVPLGLGVDLGFGKSDMRIGAKGDVNVTGLNNSYITNDRTGNISVSAGGDMTPNFFNLKLMTGLGFNFGPVILDIPFTYYFANSGFNVGITLGFIW